MESDTRAVVIAEVDGSNVSVEALAAPDVIAARLQLARSEGLEIVVLEYAQTLDALGIRAGDVPFVPEDGIPLPTADRTWISRVGFGDETWVASEDWPNALEAFRFAAVTAKECLELGGCLMTDSNGAELGCRLPCPEPPLVVQPQVPLSPTMAPCAPGWISIVSASAALCSPYPDVRVPRTCPSGQMHPPGEVACAPLARSCPSGDFADGLPPSAIHVRAGATAPANGSRAAPYATIDEAVQNSPDGAFIAVAKGRYAEARIVVTRPLTIEGACAAETIVSVPNGNALHIASSGVELREFTIEAAEGITIERGGHATAEALVIRTPRGTGIVVDGGTLSAQSLTLGPNQIGILVRNGGDVGATSVVMNDANTGLSLRDAASFAMLNDFAIDGAFTAVDVIESSSVTLGRGLISRYTGSGIRMDGTRAAISDIVIRDGADRSGFGIEAYLGADIEADRVWIERARTSAISVTNATATLRELVIDDTRPDTASLDYGDALRAAEGATIRVDRGLIRESRAVAALAVGARIELNDVTIEDTLGRQSDGRGGIALLAVESGEIQVKRVAVTRSRGFGLIAELAGVVRGSDLRITDGLPRVADGAYGRAIDVSGGGEVELVRVHAAQNLSAAVFVIDNGSRFKATDLRLEGTAKSGCFEFSCQTSTADGLVAQLGASVDIENFEIVDNDAFGFRISTNSVLLKNGRISGNAVGVQTTVLDFDFSRIARGVLLENNIVDITSFAE